MVGFTVTHFWQNSLKFLDLGATPVVIFYAISFGLRFENQIWAKTWLIKMRPDMCVSAGRKMRFELQNKERLDAQIRNRNDRKEEG